MADEAFRPISYDPSAEMIYQVFDPTERWVCGAEGEYKTALAETFQEDGSDAGIVVLIEIPGRYNKTEEPVQVRLMISPEDAEGLAKNILHSCEWLKAAKILGN